MAEETTKIHKGNPRYMGNLADKFECYIINKTLDVNSKGYKIPIQFSPNSLSDNITATYNQQAIPGGSSPVVIYSNTGARTVSLSFFVPLDYLPPNTDFGNTEEYLNALRALAYPKYVNHIVTPPNCYLHLTNIDLDGVCTQCGIDYKTDQRYGNDGALGAEVSLSFIEVLDKALSSSEVSGRTTILKDTNLGVYTEAAITNGSYNHSNSTINWGSFKLKGSNKKVKIKKLIKSGLGWGVYIPDYNDEGYSNPYGYFSVVKFYFVSTTPLNFNGNDIKGEPGKPKSSVYKICVGGESFANSTRVLQRNQQPEYTAWDMVRFQEVTNTLYYYYIYVPYIGLSEYNFEKALIRTITVDIKEFD